jgi:hypothetical protein
MRKAATRIEIGKGESYYDFFEKRLLTLRDDFREELTAQKAFISRLFLLFLRS